MLKTLCSYSFSSDSRSINLSASIKKARVTNVEKNRIAEVIQQQLKKPKSDIIFRNKTFRKKKGSLLDKDLKKTYTG